MYLLDLMKKDTRDEAAVVFYILSTCCDKGKEMCFDDFKWIIDRANFIYAKEYNLGLVSYAYLNWNTAVDLKAKNFNCDWTETYTTTKSGKIKKSSVKTNYTYKDFISEAGLKTLNKVIRRWKIYGRLIVKIKRLYMKGDYSCMMFLR